MTQTLAQQDIKSLVLDQRRRTKLEIPAGVRRLRGLEQLQGIRPSSTATRRRVLSVLFGGELAQVAEGFDLISGDPLAEEAIRSQLAEIIDAELLAPMSPEHMNRIVFWIQRLNNRQFEDVISRQRALEEGCVLDETQDPLFALYLERGCSPEFLGQYADRLMTIGEFLEQDGDAQTMLRRMRRQGQQPFNPDPIVENLANNSFPYAAGVSESLRQLPTEILVHLMRGMTHRMAAYGNRVTQLVWDSIQRFHLHPQQLRQLIQDREEYFRVSNESLGTTPEDEREARFQPQILKFLPFGSVPRANKERRVSQQGQPSLKAYLMVLLERMGDHLVMELPEGIAGMIISESRRLRAQPRSNGLYRRVASHVSRRHQTLQEQEGRILTETSADAEARQRRLQSLHRRRRRLRDLSRALFNVLPDEVDPQELPECPFAIRGGSQQPSDTEVYLRLLGFYYLRVLRQTHPQLFRLEGDVLIEEDFYRAFEISVRLETEQRAHISHRGQIRVNLGENAQGRSASRLRMILQRSHAEIPRLVLFNDLTTLLNLPLDEVLNTIAAPPEETPNHPNPINEPTPTSPNPDTDTTPEPADTSSPAQEEEALSAEQLQNILRYRMVYAGHLVQQLALSQHLQGLPQQAHQFPLKRALQVNAVSGSTPPNPFEDAVEWFHQRGLNLPHWELVDEGHNGSPEAYQYASMMATGETPAQLVNQVFTDLDASGTLDLCFPIAPPTDNLLEQLRNVADVQIIKQNGAQLNHLVHQMIRSEGCTTSFIRDFRAYMQASVRGVTMVRIRKTQPSAQLALTAVTCDESALCVEANELHFGADLCEYFELMRDVTAWLPARLHLASSILHQVASGDMRLESEQQVALFEEALSIIESDGSSASFNALNQLLTSICTATQAGEDDQPYRCMEAHAAYGYSARILELYLRSDNPLPPELLALHPDASIRERFLNWLEGRREEDAAYVNRVLMNLMERVNEDNQSEVDFLDQVLDSMGEPDFSQNASGPLLSWQERQEELITDEQKLLWLDEGFASGDPEQQQTALRVIPALGLQEPGSHLTVLNRYAGVIAPELLPEIGQQVREQGQSHLLGAELFSAIASSGQEEWRAFRWEELQDESTQDNTLRRLWCTLGMGAHRSSQSGIADISTRETVLSTLPEDDGLSALVITESLNRVDFWHESANFDRATDILLNQQANPNQVLLMLRDTGFRQLDLIEKPEKRVRLQNQLMALLQRREPLREGAYASLDRAIGHTKNANRHFLEAAVAYLRTFGPVGDLTEEKLLTTAAEFVDPVYRPDEVGAAREGAIFLLAQWVKEHCESREDQGSTLLEYMATKVVNGTDMTPQMLANVLSDDKQLNFFAEVQLIFRDQESTMVLEIPLIGQETLESDATDQDEDREETIAPAPQVFFEDLSSDPRIQNPENPQDLFEIFDDLGRSLCTLSAEEIQKRLQSIQKIKVQLATHLDPLDMIFDLKEERLISRSVDQHDQTSVDVINGNNELQTYLKISEALQIDPLAWGNKLPNTINLRHQDGEISVELTNRQALWDFDFQLLPQKTAVAELFTIVISDHHGQQIDTPKSLQKARKELIRQEKEQVWEQNGLSEIRSYCRENHCTLRVQADRRSRNRARRAAADECARQAILETYAEGDNLQMLLQNEKCVFETENKELFLSLFADFKKLFDGAEPAVQLGEGLNAKASFDPQHDCWTVRLEAAILSQVVQESIRPEPSDGLSFPIKFVGLGQGDNPDMAIPIDPFDPSFKHSLRRFFERNGVAPNSAGTADQSDEDSSPEEQPRGFFDRLRRGLFGN